MFKSEAAASNNIFQGQFFGSLLRNEISARNNPTLPRKENGKKTYFHL